MMPRHGRQLERRVSLLLSSPPVHPGSTLREMRLDRYANVATAAAAAKTLKLFLKTSGSNLHLFERVTPDFQTGVSVIHVSGDPFVRWT